MKKTISMLLILAMLCGLLQGCLFVPLPREDQTESALPQPSGTEQVSQPPVNTGETGEPVTTEPVGDDEALIRWQNGGHRDYLPDEPVDMVSFRDMPYVHPDVEAMYAAFDDLAAKAKDGDSSADELLKEYYQVCDSYMDFYSMDTLANIRYSINTTDTFYKDEYDFCEAEKPNVEEKLEALYKAFAASSSRDALEEAYFGEGFFLQYDNYEVYTNEAYLALSKQEEELLAEYRSLLEDPMVEIDGEQRSYWELMETNDNYLYFRALQAYYNQYNPKIGEIYVKLVKLRKQLAQTLDYDSYSDYSYSFTYERDYTPEQGVQFVNEIKQELVPVYREAEANAALANLDHFSVGENQVIAMVKSAAQNIGGTVADAFRFMDAYGLYDIKKSEEKKDASFQTYIYSYEAPFLMVNSKGTSDDYTTLAHEFGHFTDSYYNYGSNSDLETAETYSQAMEFLALCYTDALKKAQKEKLLKIELVDSLQTFISQAAYASFEQQVFALPDKDLTVENINGIFLQVCKDFGFYYPGYEFYYAQCWIDVMHFFEVPDYVISYCVSAETALQIYQLEAAEAGQGVAAYFRLLDRDHEAGLLQVMEDAQLNDPFREGCVAETAEFFRTQLGLKDQ